MVQAPMKEKRADLVLGGKDVQRKGIRWRCFQALCDARQTKGSARGEGGEGRSITGESKDRGKRTRKAGAAVGFRGYLRDSRGWDHNIL